MIRGTVPWSFSTLFMSFVLLVLSCVVSCIVLSCLQLSWVASYCLVLSCLVLSCLVLSCLVLSSPLLAVTLFDDFAFTVNVPLFLLKVRSSRYERRKPVYISIDEIVKSFLFSSCASWFISQLPPPMSAFPQTRKNYALQAQYTCLHRFATENLFIMSYEMAFHRSILPHIVTSIFFPAVIIIFSLSRPSWRICDFVAILPKSWSVHPTLLLPWGQSF